MMSTSRTLLAYGLLLGLAPGGACSCEDDTLTDIDDTASPRTCEPTFDCGQGRAYRQGECRVARCQSDPDCCPGQRCSVATGLCVDQWTACTSDLACQAVPGQACIPFRGGQFCGYPNRAGQPNRAGIQACDADPECPPGVSCFGRRCVPQAPCGGACASGEVCDVDSNRCFPLPSCTMSCGEGALAVLADPDVMSGEACCRVECVCAPLPPVPLGRYGWHASLVASPSAVLVSAYDEQYGDLVLVRFDASGQPTGIEYVDGFPSSGPLFGNPKERRGGRTAPGPDVGEYTSIGQDNGGVIHIAYYDRDRGDLRYARGQGGQWSSHVVDAEGDVGRFTSLVLGPDGRPRIAYMSVEGPDPNRASTALRWAEALSPSPLRARDWRRYDVDRRSGAAPVCGGGCRPDAACVELGGEPTCATLTRGCGPCRAGEVCIAVQAGPTCRTELETRPALDDLPMGTGLFASAVLTATGTPIIAYYDRIDGSLRLATGAAPGRFILQTLDGGDPALARDVGAHVSLAIDVNDRIALAYMDQTANELIYLEPSTNVREVIDNGVVPPDLRMVGADASLRFERSGRASVAYQDGTELDLVYARRTGTPPRWSRAVVRGARPSASARGTAAGFYASQAQVDDRAYLASVSVDFDAQGNLRLHLTVDVQELR